MAIREIRKENEEVLRKICKPVTAFDENLWTLLDDMKETMYEADGVGLAAPQVGILKRIFVIDVGEGIVEFINPELIAKDGEQFGEEGCLSVPNCYGEVRRANYVKMRAQNRHGETFEIEGTELFARAMQHENDHLDGKLFVDFVEGDLFEVE